VTSRARWISYSGWKPGFVQVNQFITPRATLSYGGLKMSGLGKENTLESMLEHFTSSKTVIINPGRLRD
jgi:acyl-CoA reductase-like NAD-dependent aldehyde dehydrogenase